ncbi:MAG TPA: prepilin-type N-terminal cleavage/methylation domain-containing protein [Planctomycetes bacterium]|nr:prepilin-type N-terminal cleavage/methylation domain-containing protein [Planctomycetota bacterium]
MADPKLQKEIRMISALPGAEGGFTLLEILAALLILALGVTTALGVFARGLGIEQGSELIHDSARLATLVQERYRNEGILGRVGEALPPPVQDALEPGFPGMKYDLRVEADPESASRVFLDLRVRWLRGGEEVGERYRFPMRRALPLSARIRALKERKG